MTLLVVLAAIIYKLVEWAKDEVGFSGSITRLVAVVLGTAFAVGVPTDALLLASQGHDVALWLDVAVTGVALGFGGGLIDSGLDALGTKWEPIVVSSSTD